MTEINDKCVILHLLKYELVHYSFPSFHNTVAKWSVNCRLKSLKEIEEKILIVEIFNKIQIKFF